MSVGQSGAAVESMPAAVRPPVVGVSFVGDARDPRARSGTPFGVVTGLEALGVRVHVLRAAMPPVIDKTAALLLSPPHLLRTATQPWYGRLIQAYSAAHVASPMTAIRTWSAGRGARKVRVDGWVQLGAGYRLDVSMPRVVYDDMTVPQATRYSYRNWSALGERDVVRRQELQTQVYNSSAMCCMTSSWAAQSAIDELGVPASRIGVVAAGTHEHSRAVIRDWSRPRFLLVGFDFERKNGPRVVRGFKTVRERFPESTLDVVGGHPRLDEPGVTGHGILRRDVPEQRELLRGLFDRATCFVMPSVYEPAGVVFTEAAAAGLPSIGGSIGGSRDFIGEGGYIVNPLDQTEIADAMLRLANPETAERLGALAAGRTSMFTWPAVAARLLLGLGIHSTIGPDVSFLPFQRVPGAA